VKAAGKVKRAAINSSAQHVFDVLRSVSDAAEPPGVSDIGRRLGLTGSTVFRALTTLEASGYVSRFRNLPQFELGTMPYLLNRALLNRFELTLASRPFLRELAQETGETVSLNVRLGWYSLRLSGVYGSRDIYHRDRLGELGFLHHALPGRAILAFLTDTDVAGMARFLADMEEEWPGVGGWAALRARLQAAEKPGFLAEALPMSSGFCAIGMPVRDETGAAIASITINGPVFPSEKIGGLLAVRDRLEALIMADPPRFVSPFAHLPPERIVLKVPRSKAEP
jgi:DNA-binding IclR family transcriptional regulator